MLDAMVALVVSMDMAPVVSMATPPVPASMSIPPAALDAMILIAFAAASPPVRFRLPAVDVMLRSNPGAPVCVMLDATVALVVSMDRAPVVSKATPPVPASMSIPPAALEAFNLRAFAAARDESMSI